MSYKKFIAIKKAKIGNKWEGKIGKIKYSTLKKLNHNYQFFYKINIQTLSIDFHNIIDNLYTSDNIVKLNID